MEALSREGLGMLYWAAIFLVLAIVAAVVGFGAVAGAGIGIAKVLFWIFVILFIISLVAGWMGGRRGVTPRT